MSSDTTRQVAHLSPVEKRALLAKLVREKTRTSNPVEKPVHRMFEEQARRTPDAVAVGFEGTTLSYAELNARANRLAHHLRTLGVGPEVLVGLCVERGLDMVVGLLGVLKAGGAYVPLDPDFPASRIAFMLETRGSPCSSRRSRCEAACDASGTARRLPRRGPSEIAMARRRRPRSGARPPTTWPTSSTRRARRAAQGGADPAPGAGELPPVDASTAGLDGERHAAGRDDALVRHRRAGAVPAAGGRGAGRGRRAATRRPTERGLPERLRASGAYGAAGDAGDLAAAARSRAGRETPA